MVLQLTTETYSLTAPAELPNAPVRALVPVDFADPAVDLENERHSARSRLAAIVGWRRVGLMEHAGLMVLPREVVEMMVEAETRLKSLTILDWTIDMDLKRVYVNGVDARLTPTEWAITELLARRVNRVVSSAEILERVWGPMYREEAHLLRVNVARVRAKVEPDRKPGERARLIRTRAGVGYWLAGQDEQERGSLP